MSQGRCVVGWLVGWLDFAPHEHPSVCQFGGSDPSALAEAATYQSLLENPSYIPLSHPRNEKMS